MSTAPLLRTRHCSIMFCADHGARSGTRPPKVQCHPRGWNVRGLPEWRFWPVGIDLSPAGDAGRLCRPALLPVYWNRLADALGMGFGAPSVGQPDLAVHADVVLGLHDFRLGYLYVVLRRRAFVDQTWTVDFAS